MNTKRNNSENKQFREFFIDEIKDIYWAEKHLSAALKKMKKAATSPTLASSFEKHIAETDGQIERLKKVFELLGKTPQAKKCDAMEGLVSEAMSVIEDTETDSFTRDAGLIIAARKTEHYEIATYEKLLGEKEVSSELEATLKEEKKTDSLLSCLSEEEAYRQTDMKSGKQSAKQSAKQPAEQM